MSKQEQLNQVELLITEAETKTMKEYWIKIKEQILLNAIPVNE